MPSCSPCGLAVDWLRSCYRSRWQLFSDSNVSTPGRYYFSPPNTPFVQGVHNYGSRNWYEKNWQLEQGLGESLTASQKWNRGDQPAVLPRNHIVGSPSCLSAGELIADALQPQDERNGFAVACYAPAVPLDPIWETVSSWGICALQFFYASIIRWISYGNTYSPPIAFQMLIGGNPKCTYHDGGGVWPNLWTCITPSCSIAVMNGTQNFQQAATQAFLAIISPQDLGGFSGSWFYYNGSSFVQKCLEDDGADFSKPIMLAGHSYGGAVCAMLAARYYGSKGAQSVRLLTFGAPKVGDQRLQQQLGNQYGLALANDDDLVTALPPDKVTLYPVALFLGLPLLYVWDQWYRLPNQYLQDVNGHLSANNSPILDFQTLLNYTNRALAHLQLPTITAHYIDEYRRRIEARCPQPTWPVSPALWLFLHTDAYGGRIKLHSPRTKGGAMQWDSLEVGKGILKVKSQDPFVKPGALQLGAGKASFGNVQLGAVDVQRSAVELSSTAAAAGPVELSSTAAAAGPVELSARAAAIGAVELSARAAVMGAVELSARAAAIGAVELPGPSAIGGIIEWRATEASPGGVLLGAPVLPSGTITLKGISAPTSSLIAESQRINQPPGGISLTGTGHVFIAPTRIQTFAGGGNAAFGTVNAPGSYPVTGGNLLVVCVAAWGFSPTPTNSGGGTFVQIGSYITNGTVRVGMFYMKNCPGSSAHTFQCTGSSYVSMVGCEYSGLSTTAPLSGGLISATGSSTAPASGTISASVAGSVVCMGYGQGSNVTTSATITTSGWTDCFEVYCVGGAKIACGFGDVVNTGSAQTGSFTINPSSVWSCVGALFVQ
jgi:pimeloyl-ACP methyl ester carboxylesterase